MATESTAVARTTWFVV